jgi:serine/threonine-protein kinase
MPLDLALVDGEICYANGEYEAAYNKLLEAAQLSKDSALVSRSYILAAQCCQQLGVSWIDREIRVLEDAINRVGVENGIVVQMLSEAYIRQYTTSSAQNTEALERADEYLSQLISRGYQTYAILQNHAVVLQYLGKYDEAETCLKEMLDIYPNNYRVPMRLAILYIDREGQKPVEERDYAEFGQYLEKARSLYKNSASQDSEMLRLEDFAAQLSDFGWEY